MIYTFIGKKYNVPVVFLIKKMYRKDLSISLSDVNITDMVSRCRAVSRIVKNFVRQNFYYRLYLSI